MKINENQRLILGPPGCGKTTRSLKLVSEELESGTAPDRIALVSFTKKAVNEAVTRACSQFSLSSKDLPYFRTVHSMCFRALRATKQDMMDSTKYKELGDILGYRFEGTFDESETGLPVGGEKGDQLLFLDNYARITCKTLRETWETADSGLDWYELERLSKTLAAYKHAKLLFDFTDLLTMFVERGVALPVDFAVIDEAQDLSALQWKVLRVAFSKAAKVYIAGDDDQCQPPGTQVRTTAGYKGIEDIDPKTDGLISYSRIDAQVFGLRSGGYSFTKASRYFSGELLDIDTYEKKSSCTPNHKWLVKWTPEIKQSNKCVVYIMRKGDWFRVGWCKLFVDGGGFHLTTRANIEKAEHVWILSMFDSRTDASVEESIVAAKYGIPTSTFEPVTQSVHITAESIERIFTAVDSRTGALRALTDYGRLEDKPFVNRTKPSYSRYGSSIMELAACNLFTDVMMVPVFTESRSVEWEEFTLSRRPYEGLVYSLDVEKYHTYIADGLVTCNSIYKWSGADLDSFLSLEGEREVLSQSFRLPRAIYKRATEIISNVPRRFSKPFNPRDSEGAIDSLQTIDYLAVDPSETTMILVRNVYLLARVQNVLKGQGHPFIGRHGYSSIKHDHVDAITCWEALYKGKEIQGKRVKNMFAHMNIGHFLARGAKAKLATESDNRMFTFAELQKSYGVLKYDLWHESLEGIELSMRAYYLSIMHSGRKITDVPNVTIQTIHGVKGGEADHVVILPDMSKRTYEQYQKDPVDEVRVAYVAVTRAKKKLSIVLPSSQRFYSY